MGLFKMFIKQDLYKKVAWIAEKNAPFKFSGNSVNLRDFELSDYINEEQYKQNIPKQFCNEWQ